MTGVRASVLAVVTALVVVGCAVVPVSGEEATSAPASPTPSSELELEIADRVFELANRERAEQDVGELRPEPALDEVARGWSQYLVTAGGELAHNPDFGDQIPPGWTSAGENVAWIDGVLDAEEIATRVHEGWMASEDHRANLLNPAYTHLGVGVAHDGNRGFYLTQNFASY